MKSQKFLILIFLISFLSSCDKNDEFDDNLIQNGFYQGYFAYQETSYWCSIEFDDGKYIEWPSGGAMNQKGWGCITTGSFSISSGIISFHLDSFKHSWDPQLCDPDILMPGDYEFVATGKQDSVVFKRGEDEHQIVYHLKKGE
ncbi:MAG: hypothetical protein ACOCWM_05990 [Cyclobacteriaceae bacterium]